MSCKSLSAFALALLLAAAPAMAHDHDTSHSAATEAQEHAPHHGAVTVAAPSLEDSISKLESLVAAKKLGDTHEVIEAASTALEGIVPPASQKARFEGAAHQLQQQLNALHTATDAGDQAGSEGIIKKVRGAYKLVQATLK